MLQDEVHRMSNWDSTMDGRCGRARTSCTHKYELWSPWGWTETHVVILAYDVSSLGVAGPFIIELMTHTWPRGQRGSKEKWRRSSQLLLHTKEVNQVSTPTLEQTALSLPPSSSARIIPPAGHTDPQLLEMEFWESSLAWPSLRITKLPQGGRTLGMWLELHGIYRIDILTTQRPLIHEYGISLHLFRPSLLSLSNVFNVWVFTAFARWRGMLFLETDY